MITREKLLQYCEKQKIAVHKSATLDQLIRSIVRASLHKTRIFRKNCFGFWENENSNCFTCDHEQNCFKSSFGIDKKSYFKQMENLENPRLRWVDKKMKK